MPLVLNHQMREQMEHDETSFPLSYFDNELPMLPDRVVPVHWHPELEFVRAISNELRFQIGMEHLLLHAGESIFINSNTLHGIQQREGKDCDAMPNIVFSPSLLAPECSLVYQKYILPILRCDELPYVIFHSEDTWQAEVNRLLLNAFESMQRQDPCYEMAVQRNLNCIFELLFLNSGKLPRHPMTRFQLAMQIRIQQMQTFISAHYAEPISLSDIAASASISRSEVNRCYNSYLGVSPMEALLRHRLCVVQKLLAETNLPLREISSMCGFNSESYFSRCFRKMYGCAPGSFRSMRK